MFLDIDNPFADSAYAHLSNEVPQIPHDYGNNVHILADVFLLTHLAFLCEEKTEQPAVNSLVRDLYRYLIRAVLIGEFPRRMATIKTRMFDSDKRGLWTGQVLDPNVPTVTVNILRAGALPSQVCFDFLNKTLTPKLMRQDHVVVSRRLDDKGQVSGSHLSESKIGGKIDDAIVLLPDPMGATGGSLVEVLSHYKEKNLGTARKFIALHLIVTPDYLKRLKEKHPEAIVYALRLDRGASSQEVLLEKPGVRWSEESGLTEKQYIIPGAGGLGEIINNSYC